MSLVERSSFGDMLSTLFDRRRSRRVRRADERSVSELCLALLDAEGEVSGLQLGQAVLDKYVDLDWDEKLSFFRFLDRELDIDTDAIARHLEAYRQNRKPADYRAFARAAEPKRQELLRRLNQPPDATRLLVDMRADLLRVLKSHPELRGVDYDFQHLFRSWFNRGFLVLQQISWDAPASILEKIVEYEAVHAIDDWDDLRRRLYPQDRRCFAYFHPTMPDDPLIFVEIALTMAVPGSIQHLLSEERETREADETRVAVFYSISNCQEGLHGISFGNLLIKQVVSELRQELPNLETFVTLSPIPGLNDWLAERSDAVSRNVLSGTAEPEDIRACAADYLLNAKTGKGMPLDPVARFHLGNGAQVHAVHAGADSSEVGIKRSSGAMVNYHYDLQLIEKNHEAFVLDGTVAISPALRGSLKPKKSNKRG